MALETKLNLNQETIDMLQDLIQVNIDSANGFREAAELMDDELIASKLINLANVREQQAVMLQEFVAINHNEPRREGSYAAAMHRVWMNARAMMGGNDTCAMLAEAERGEDHIKRAYESLLKTYPGTAMNDVLLQQYEQVKNDHDMIRDLRDALKS